MKMKKLYINQKGNIVIKEVNPPFLGKKGCIVKVKYALISSGTELSVIKKRKLDQMPLYKRFLKSKDFRKSILSKIRGKKSLRELYHLYKDFQVMEKNKNFSSPKGNLIPIGYSCAGIVQESNTDLFNKGDRVACVGSSHAELILSPKNLTCKVPPNVELKNAAFVAIGAIALHAMHRADVRSEENIGVIGTGLIGLVLIQLLKTRQVKIFAYDINNNRLELATYLGADFAYNSSIDIYKEDILKNTKGKGLDKIIICASSQTSKPLSDALDLICKNGKIIIVGAFPIEINRTLLYEKEADILISRSYGYGRYDPDYEDKGLDYPQELMPFTINQNMKSFLELLSKKKINLSPLLSNIVYFNNAQLASKNWYIIKIFWRNRELKKKQTYIKNSKTARKINYRDYRMRLVCSKSSFTISSFPSKL